MQHEISKDSQGHAYVQFEDGTRIVGRAAELVIQELKFFAERLTQLQRDSRTELERRSMAETERDAAIRAAEDATMLALFWMRKAGA